MERSASRRRAAEGEERPEGATNTNQIPNPKQVIVAEIKRKFSLKIPDLNTHDLVFITLHPYKKAKCFARLQNISKVYDLLRKKLKNFLIISEKNSESDDRHYHVLGYLPKDVIYRPANFKIWIQKIVSKSGVNFMPREYAAEQLNDRIIEVVENEENVNLTEIEESFWKSYTSEVQHEYARSYIQAKYSVLAQTDFIINYMTKQEELVQYKTFI